MQLNFFTPSNKVHKQRNIMRETDWRLVRYSKRGLALGLVVFILSMFFGDYYSQQPLMASIFGLGILTFIVIRAYFLFRFETLYSRAPNRWRNMYFSITLLHAAWWGFMLAIITFVIGLAAETPLLWLYTIAFFSSCSHVFSPYPRFYSLYMFLALVPCGIVATISLEALNTIYGFILLLLFYLLQRQGRNQSQAYWDRLQANYDLTQRANALEAEKITSLSSLSNKDTLFSNLAGELKAHLREIMSSLQLLKLAQLPEQEQQLVTLAEQKSQQQMQVLQNILEFSLISRKQVVLNEEVMDIRGVLEKAIHTTSDLVYNQQIELFAQFSKDFPITVRGDSERVEEILKNIILSALDYSNKGSMLLDFDYNEGKEEGGELKVKIKLEKPIRNPEIEQQLHDAFKPHYAINMSQGLSLAIAKGLANAMNGSAGAAYKNNGQLTFWFTVTLPLVKSASSEIHNISKLNGKRLLLFQPPKILENEYKHTLETWGFIVDIFYDYDAALAAVVNSLETSIHFDLVMIYTHIDDLEGVTLAKLIYEKTHQLQTPQLLCVTDTQSKMPAVQQLCKTSKNIELLIKPISYKQLRKRFKHLLISDQAGNGALSPENFLSGKQILLLQKEDIDRTIAQVMLNKLGCTVTAVNTKEEALEAAKAFAYDAFITESHLKNTDMKTLIESFKAANTPLHKNGYVLPILGLTNQEQDGEETRCLQCGMNYYIDSPLQIDDLRAILRRWIGRSIHMAEEQSP